MSCKVKKDGTYIEDFNLVGDAGCLLNDMVDGENLDEKKKTFMNRLTCIIPYKNQDLKAKLENMSPEELK